LPVNWRRVAAETLGTFFLLMMVVGSGIMGARLANGNPALVLLANSMATGAGLSVLILMLGKISGAHFNPVISLVETIQGRLTAEEFFYYILAQLTGACAGVIVAHLMFGESYWGSADQIRAGWPLLLSEFIATFGLVATIRGIGMNRPLALAFGVGLYIASAYWFTASTSFANPVVTIARALTPTFTGIRWLDVPGFCLAQVCGAMAADRIFNWFEVVA
jgi:glycerol uptake facilitator-like aquaporin